MKIGIVLPSIPGYSETFFRSKIIGLQNSGHIIYLFVNIRTDDSIKCNVIFAPQLKKQVFLRVLHSFYILIKAILKAPTQTQRLWKEEKKSGASYSKRLKKIIINSHILPYSLDWLHFGFATMGIDRELIGKAIGAKTAVSFRGYDISIYPLKYSGCYNKLWRNLDKIHTISDDLLRQAYDLELSKEIPVQKIPPAIEVQNFNFERLSTGKIHQPINILTVGRLNWKKGGELMLDALAILKRHGYDFNYTLVGEGKEIERLIFAAYQNGIKGEVNFLGRIAHNKIPYLMSQNDIYLQYSIQEGFCNAVLEAQAAGMLCVVSDAEGLSENVLDQQTGWVIPRNEPALLADKLVEIIQMSEEKLMEIRNKARERIKLKFNIHDQMKAFNEFYN